MTLPPTESHLVGFTYEAWGHMRPLIAFCACIVKLRPVAVTLFTPYSVLVRAKAELTRNFDAAEEAYSHRIRVIGLENPPSRSFLDTAFKEAWKKLVAEEELVCAKTGERYPPLIKPKTVILDCFAHQPVRDIRAISGNDVKIYMWFPALLVAWFYLYGPESLGGRGNVLVKAEEEAARTGRSPTEVAGEMMFAVKGEVVRVPGLPPMYDHEYYPQDFEMPPEFNGSMLAPTHETFAIADGVCVGTPEPYERGAVAALKKWYNEQSKEAYVIGPLLASAADAIAKEKTQSEKASAIEAFLDQTLKTSGNHSLLYMSFGSLFWPVKTPEKLWAFLDVVMELNIPFIFSHASSVAVVPDFIQEKVEAYGKGILSPWSPQQLILHHPATGWFVTHGGHNGVIESVVAGVPQICWPFGADQPLNAVMLAEVHGVGYELIEVRSGHGLKRIYRTGRAPVGTIDAVKAEARDVLVKAFGEDGAKKREKLEALQRVVLEVWQDDRSSKKDVLAFLEAIGS